MATKGKKHDGRSSDLTFSWMLTTLGPEWQQWQELAAEWMATQDVNTNDKRKALTPSLKIIFLNVRLMPLATLNCFLKAITGIIAILRNSKKL